MNTYSETGFRTLSIPLDKVISGDLHFLLYAFFFFSYSPGSSRGKCTYVENRSRVTWCGLGGPAGAHSGAEPVSAAERGDPEGEEAGL